MGKKIVKKRKKLKVKNFLIFILIILLLAFFVLYFLYKPIKTILITNTDYLNDNYVMDIANIDNYPSFLMTDTFKIKKELKKDPYIIDCKIRKKIHNLLEIKIEEAKPLFYNSNNNKYVLSNNVNVKEDNINSSFRVPRLINYVPDKKYKKFVESMEKIDSDIIGKMSDIEYVPNDFDKERFLVYMDDGNSVYLTLTKFKQVNYYDDVVGQLEGKKGILYLDSGNHFEIKE